MKHPHTTTEESFYEKGTRYTGDSFPPDVYNGPRSGMVLDKRHSEVYHGKSVDGDDDKIGVAELAIRLGLAMLILSAVLISLAVVPFVIFGYFVYSTLTKAYNNFLRPWIIRACKLVRKREP